MAEQAIIEARGLVKRYGAVAAVDGLSLQVRRGEIFGLVGPDGAGKTTALRLLAGILGPDQGEVKVCGYDVARHPDQVRDRIGYMAQRFGLYGDLTVQENLDFYADLFGVSRAARKELAPRLLQMTRMAPFAERQAGRLSGGMRQKLALMCTLLHTPEVLLLDEPTCGVDPVSRRDFWDILYGLVREGLTVVMTTAYLDEAERCERVGLMYRGRMIQCATPGELKQGTEEACYRLRCPDQRAAKPLLEGLEGVASAEPFGGALHVFLAPGYGPERVARELGRAGLGPCEVEPIPPSLEDVFILMIRKQARAVA